MKHLKLISTAILLFSLSFVQAQTYTADWKSLDTRKIPSWFHQDKFGIFIHWGVYSVPSFSRVIPDGYSEWYWCNYNDSTRHNYHAVREFHDKNYGKDFKYEQFAPMFRAELFDAEEWASIFKKSGAKYVVLTSKHHEGFTLWPNEHADKSWGRPWNAVTNGPKRDVLGDLTTAVKKSGLRMGYYYSLMEWYNPVFLKDTAEYVDKVMIPQLKDLVTKYKPSVIFSDGEWIMDEKNWRSTEIIAWLFNESPVKDEIVVNDRWGKTTRKTHPCTYYTSEYGSGLDKDVVWEESRGMGQSYGYNRMEKLKDYKTSEELIIILSDIVSKGGNLLLDIGPAADGTIPVIMEDRLAGMGKWLDLYGEAIYGTQAWKQTRQWSKGAIPTIEGGNYQTNYDITELVKPNSKTAHIEMFFTQKGNTVYAIVPRYSPKLTMNDVSAVSGLKVSIPGLDKNIPYTVTKTGIQVDLSGLKPGDLPSGIFVVKLENGMK